MTPEQIRTLRISLGLSADAFAAELGFMGKNRAISVYKLETGKNQPSGSTLKVLHQLAEKLKE